MNAERPTGAPSLLRCYRDPHLANRFFYIPGVPTAERALNGTPTLMLMLAGAHSRLQLGAQWTAEAQDLERLRARLLKDFPDVAPADLDLQPAPAVVRKVEVRLKDGPEPTTLASARSSGFPPQTAIFAIGLERAAQQAAAMRALNGVRGEVLVCYTVSHLTADGSWQEECLCGDVADWFANQSALAHVVVAEPGIAPEQPAQVSGAPNTASTVGFELSESLQHAPIAFVRLERQGVSVTLVGPTFAPVSLPAVDGEVVIAVQHSDGGELYVERMATRGERITLEAAQLGICLVEVDASACNGLVREVRATVAYRPQGAGRSDDRTIYLRDPPWREAWWVVSGAKDLAGDLEVNLKITLRDGRTLEPIRFKQSKPTITVNAPLENGGQGDPS
jgi:hypothetical protein